MVVVGGQLAGQHVRADQRQARAHPADRGGAPGGVAEQRDAAAGPGRGEDLADRLGVEVVGRREPLEHPPRLPPGVAEVGPQPAEEHLGRPVLHAGPLLAVGEPGQGRPRRAVPVRPQRHAAPAGRVVPAPPRLVGVHARDGPVGDLQVSERISTSSPKTRSRVEEPMPSAATTRSKVSSGPCSNVTRTRPSGPSCSDEPDDAVAEPVLDRPVPRQGLADEDLGQVAAQDLALPGRPAGLAGPRREGRDHLTVATDELGPLLAGRRGGHGVVDPHPAQHLARRAPDVDVLPARPQRRRPLQHDGLPARPPQPEGQGRSGDARAADQNSAHAGHPTCR